MSWKIKVCYVCKLPKNKEEFTNYEFTRRSSPCCKSCRIKQNFRFRRKRKLDAFAAYGGSICVCCGETNQFFLCIDHVNGGGNAHRKEIAGGSRGGDVIYSWLKKNNYPPGFQVLCFNCNNGKHFNGGVVCPHKSVFMEEVTNSQWIQGILF